MEVHSNPLARHGLQLPESLMDVARFNGSAAFLRRIEQASLLLALFGGISSVGTTTVFPMIFALLDFQSLLSQGLDDLEGEETQDVDNIVVRLGLGDDTEAGPLTETLGLAVGEGGLATLRPEDVLLLGHVLGAFVSSGQTLEGGGILALLLVIFVILALGNLDGEEAVVVPRQGDLGALVLWLGCYISRASSDAGRIVGGSEIGCIATTLVVRVFDVLANILPGEERAEALNLLLVVAYEENQVVDADRTGSTTGSEVGTAGELQRLLANMINLV